MQTTAASYRNPQPQTERTCRKQGSPTLAVRIHRGEVARTLDELCALGLVEKFTDQYRITRYRPTNGRVA